MILVSCSHLSKNGKVILIKQWPLSPRVNTLNIEVSAKSAEYANQRSIYDQLLKTAETSNGITLIVEGCDAGTEINESYQGTYNGWNISNLSVMKDQAHYADIITMLPMKLKVKIPNKIRAFCGDDEDLKQSSQLALSEARGYMGFFYRMDSTKNDPAKFIVYKKALEETEKKPVEDPLQYVEQKAVDNVKTYWKGVQKRNEILTKTAKKYLDENPIIVVSGLHAKDLEKQLKDEGIPAEVLTPEGYPQASENLGDELTKSLKK